MTKRMLIDASHPEETRVVVADGTRIEELDFESSAKRQLRALTPHFRPHLLNMAATAMAS